MMSAATPGRFPIPGSHSLCRAPARASRIGGGPVQTRRILELIVLADIALVPVRGYARIWSHKTLGTTQPGSILHGVAEIVSVMV